MHSKLIAAAFSVALLPALALGFGQQSSTHAHPASSAHATAVAGEANATRIEACINASTAMIGNLDKGDFKAATADFDANMQSHLGADNLRSVWQQVGHQLGKLQGHGEPQNVMYQNHVVITQPLHFEKGDVNAQVACDADGKIAGFFLRPAAAPAAQ
jgi:Protein of unknown function (DUF3887)